ncbi:MAG: hypothetical protein V1875_08825 [Candidatus Altiarchaeota archaeon]
MRPAKPTSHVCFLVFAAILLLAASVGAQSNVNVSVVVPLVSWNGIAYPEGVYEPIASGLPGTHLFTFNITFLNYTSTQDSRLECVLLTSDGNLKTISKTTSDPVPVAQILSYTLQGSDPISKLTPWQVINCSQYDSLSRLKFTSNSTYGSPLSKMIYVHGNTWTRFDTFDDDAYRASQCFIGIPKRYFNNTLYCDYSGDVAFSVAMSRGMGIEGECNDGQDNDENGDIDCSDIYCQGIPYSCLAHRYAGDPFYGTCRNGLCWETKRLGGHDITYYYTRYMNPDGVLKVRIRGGIFSTSKPLSFAMTGMEGFESHGTYAGPQAHRPVNEYVTPTSYNLEDPSGYRGNMDFVMYVQPYAQAGWNTFNLYMVSMGQDLLIDSLPYYKGSNAPSNWDETLEMPPTITEPCSDSLDNDLNYLTDCQEPGCDGRVGGSNCLGGSAYCEYGNELTCDDCFDNDANGKVDCSDRTCDGKVGGKDCDKKAAYCQYESEETCDDCFDNDMDDLLDCQEQICLGTSTCPLPNITIENKTCTEYVDGLCGQCPMFENFRYNSCANRYDDNGNEETDCEDQTCLGEIGSFEGSQRCESSQSSCGDGFDNTGGELIDCMDPSCFGRPGPEGPQCAQKESTASLCTDNFDNDGDGAMDCIDADCWGLTGSGCSPKSWTSAQKYDVPYMTPLTTIDPTTVQYAHLQRLHVNDSYVLRFRGLGTYDAVIITVGDATDSGARFPYNATSCALTGSPYLKWAATQEDVGQVQHKPSLVSRTNPLRTFDATLTCDNLPAPQTNTFPLTITNLQNGNPETAELPITSAVYGMSRPTVSHLEIEPQYGDSVRVPYGGHFDVRAIPNSSEVSQCYFNFSGNMYVTGGDCINRYFSALDDFTLPVTVAVEDGSGNLGPYMDLVPVNVSVTPVMLNFTTDRAFAKTGDPVGFGISFITGQTNAFPGPCTIKVLDASESAIRTESAGGNTAANTIACKGSISTGGLANGVYYLEGEATDANGGLGRSTKKTFYICNDFDSKGQGWDCSKADFSMSGIPDLCILNGSLTTTTSTSTTTLFTTTTVPPWMNKTCSSVCQTNYFTQTDMCSYNQTCQEATSGWMFVHDDRGDKDCERQNGQRRYCCCQLDGLVPPTLPPTINISAQCTNDQKDQGELEKDCGGICPPCSHCFNIVKDEDEEGTDCGGSCLPCSMREYVDTEQPRIYIIGIPAYVTVGTDVAFTVVDQRGLGIQTYLESSLPNGSVVKSVTDINGHGRVNSTIVGFWSLEARRTGYMSATTGWAAIPEMTPIVAIQATSSILVPLLIALALFRSWRRRRRGYVATEAAVRRLNVSGLIDKYSPLQVTPATFRNLPELRHHLCAVSISASDEYAADKLAQKHDVTLEIASLLLISRKRKAAKMIVDRELQLKEYELTKIVTVWEEIQGKLT